MGNALSLSLREHNLRPKQATIFLDFQHPVSPVSLSPPAVLQVHKKKRKIILKSAGNIPIYDIGVVLLKIM
jgi:hypothetical protein